MKRKLLIAAGILGIVALSSATTYVMADRELPWTNNIYNVSDHDNGKTTVSVFDDAGNKCYVLSYWANNAAGISCLKGDKQ